MPSAGCLGSVVTPDLCSYTVVEWRRAKSGGVLTSVSSSCTEQDDGKEEEDRQPWTSDSTV